MKNHNLHTAICLLFFLLMFITSCKGQDKANASAGIGLSRESNAILKKDSFAQIDEYVVEVFEDTKGNLWFGTLSRGVARYDGKALSYFSTKDGLCDNTVVCIAEEKDGNMWFGTHNGASRYDGKTFTNYQITQGLHGAGCQILVDRNGSIWAGTNHGAFRFNGSTFSPFEIPNPSINNPSYKWEAGKVWRLIEDKKGNIWFGRDGYGACKFDGTSFTHFTKKDGLCSNNVTSIVEDKQGNIWFGCLSSDAPKYIDEGGLSFYDGNTFTKYPQLEGLHENDIYTIYEDKSGNIWIGATHFGAYRYDGKKFVVFKETDRKDLTINFGLQGILEDRNGTLWCGFSGGLFRFNGTSFTNVTQDGPWH
jgi:ligand-binding sensor domain-containing protein